MDLTEILGGMLGQKTGRGGGGAGDILRDLLGGGQRDAAPPSATRRSGPPTSDDIAMQARELEELLNISKGRRPGAAPQAQRPAPAPEASPSRPDGRPNSQGTAPPDSRQNELALLLIRAMLNAAKCDGQITPDEQQAIFEQLGSPSAEVVQFLRDECQRPLDVREFAWSVPIGMEQQVYGMSLLVTAATNDREQAYLEQLARGLRIPPRIREQLHERYGRR